MARACWIHARTAIPACSTTRSSSSCRRSAGPLCAWVAGVCLPERAHPPARVSSVYFDTPGLALLSEKVDSRASAVFAEVKRRVGSRREKTRVQLDVEAADIARWPLSDPRWAALMWPLSAAVPELPARLVPVLTLTYVRTMFVDPRCTARLTLVQHIATTAVNPGVAMGHVPVWLEDAVFEYKGRAAELPPHLGPVVRFTTTSAVGAAPRGI